MVCADRAKVLALHQPPVHDELVPLLRELVAGFADRAWDDISERKITSISVCAVWLGEQPAKGGARPWGLRELTICQRGADRGAEITCCWERLPGPVEPGFRAPTKTFWEGPLTIYDADLVDRTWDAPRATDDPIETSLSERYAAYGRATEIEGLRDTLRRLVK